MSDSRKILSLEIFFGIGLIAQLLMVFPIWNYRVESSDAVFFGRYSAKYVFVPLLNVALILGWSALLIWRQRARDYLECLSIGWRYTLVIGGGIIAFIVWLTPINILGRDYIAINWFLAALLVLASMPDMPTHSSYQVIGLTGGAVLVLFIPLFITALTTRAIYPPDEAQWSITGSSYFLVHSLSSRTHLHKFLVYPGTGWSVAAYGWILEHVAYSVETGRVVNFLFYISAFAGIGAVTGLLYGRNAAAISMCFAFLYQPFFSVADYRPDHQLPSAIIWITFAILLTLRTKRLALRSILHFACGMFSTLSLQLHAAGIVLAAGFSLFYLGEWMWTSYRNHKFSSVYPLLLFGAGALVGTGVHYVFNVLPVGGYEVYLRQLASIKWAGSQRHLPYLELDLRIEGPFVRAIVWGSLAYLVWRRNRADLQFLAIFICIVIAGTILDAVGYTSLYIALYAVPVGVWIVDGLSMWGVSPGNNRKSILILGCLITMMIAQASAFINWSALGTGLKTGHVPSPDIAFEELGSILKMIDLAPDDKIVSTHQLIWGMPDALNLISVEAESYAASPLGLNVASGLEVWRAVKPTAIVYVNDDVFHYKKGPGLEAYLREVHFQHCRHFTLHELIVDVYRQTCRAADI